MKMDLSFIGDALADMTDGICPACGNLLPPVPRDFVFTCDRPCHDAWIDRLVLRFGETKIITDMRTGKRHIVPTRVILDVGVKSADLHTYPEAHVPSYPEAHES